MKRLLQPKSVAVVGGGVWCVNVVAELAKIGFAGPVWRVHPREGFACVNDLPGVPDAAFIGVNRTATVEVVRDLAAMGAGGVVCFASGFAEAAAELGDAGDMQVALLEAAGEMPVLGPNCYGLVNYLDRVALWPDSHGGVPVARGVAMVTQSSNMAINLTMQKRGLPVAYVVTAGNQAQQGLAEIGAALLADERVTAIGFHIEGVGNVAGFAALAEEAARLGKPLIVLKVGASEEAQVATVSHTASLAGSEAGARAYFKRLGCAQVATLEGFLEALKIGHVLGRLPSNRVASLSCSGGEASLMADMGARAGVVFPPLEAGQRMALRAALGDKVALANPLDYHTYIWGDEEAMTSAFAAMMTDDHALGLLVIDVPRADRCETSAWDPAFRAVKRAQEQSGRPIAVLASIPETISEETSLTLLADGVLPLHGMAGALEAIDAMAITLNGEMPAPPRAIRAPVLVSEPEAKGRLRGAGVAVPEGAAVFPGRAASVAKRLGYPVVVKAVGAAHKSESGGVVIGLASDEAVEAAAKAMGTAEVLVERMVPGAVAEVLVGVVSDPAHGLVLTLGRGGTETELHRDVTHEVLPVSSDLVREMLGRLRMAPLLKGYRGRAAADVDALVALVLAVQDFVLANGAVVEVELNPVLALPGAALAVDALIREEEDG